MVDHKDLMNDVTQPEGIRAVMESFYNAIHPTAPSEPLNERNFDSKLAVLQSLSIFITELLKQEGALTRENRLKLVTFLDKINTYKDALTWHTISDLEKEGVMKAADRMGKKAQSAFGPV